MQDLPQTWPDLLSCLSLRSLQQLICIKLLLLDPRLGLFLVRLLLRLSEVQVIPVRECSKDSTAHWGLLLQCSFAKRT